MKRLCIILTSTLILAACATTGGHTQQHTIDCQAPDWHALGNADGKNGRYPHEISRYNKRCPALALDMSVRSQWEAGRQEGLKNYCTKAHAYELGQRGYSMNQVCPEEGLLEIQQSHALGYQQYYQRQQLNTDYWPYYHPLDWYVPPPFRHPLNRW